MLSSVAWESHMSRESEGEALPCLVSVDQFVSTRAVTGGYVSEGSSPQGTRVFRVLVLVKQLKTRQA